MAIPNDHRISIKYTGVVTDTWTSGTKNPSHYLRVRLDSLKQIEATGLNSEEKRAELNSLPWESYQDFSVIRSRFEQYQRGASFERSFHKVFLVHIGRI